MTSESPQPDPPAPKRILLVEDEPISRLTLREFLQANGYEVIPCADGSQAVSLVLAKNPDLVLLDLGLPPTDPFTVASFDGFTIMDWLRRMVTDKPPAIIVLTARDPALFKQKALDAGAVAFFQKPADRQRLLAAIRIALNEL